MMACKFPGRRTIFGLDAQPLLQVRARERTSTATITKTSVTQSSLRAEGRALKGSPRLGTLLWSPYLEAFGHIVSLEDLCNDVSVRHFRPWHAPDGYTQLSRERNGQVGNGQTSLQINSGQRLRGGYLKRLEPPKHPPRKHRWWEGCGPRPCSCSGRHRGCRGWWPNHLGNSESRGKEIRNLYLSASRFEFDFPNEGECATPVDQT